MPISFQYGNKPKRVVKKAKPKLKTLNAETASPSYYDAFRRRVIPDDYRLVQEYKQIIYTCANLNANGVVSTPLRLYVKSAKGDKPTVLNTKALDTQTKDKLASRSYLSKTLRSYVDIEEVIDHPILTLLDRANASRHMNGQKTLELVQLYQEVVGQAYLLIEANLFGIPKNLWVLPSQWIKPRKDKNSQTNSIVDYYEFSPPGSVVPIRYKPNDIIPFLMPSLEDPYVTGVSPLQSSFESNEVNKKLLSHEDALLTNEGRPDVVISPKDNESAFSGDTARRYEREWRLKFAYGRSGGAWVPDDPVNITPVTIPARDLARLEINKWSKNDVANSFSVPFALVADASHNRQQLEAAELQHAKHGIAPRLDRNVCVWNDLLVSIYDDTGRLFLAYDDPIPENRTEKLQENVQLVMNRIKTPNEARKDYGLPPIDGGDELQSINDPQAARDVTAGSGGDGRASKQGKEGDSNE